VGEIRDQSIIPYNVAGECKMCITDKKEVPEILYHYCSIDTFKEIIKNKTIRLSDIFKMKDSSEVTHLLTLLPDILAEEYAKNPFKFPCPYKKINNEKAFDLIVSDINENINDVKFSSFIACFSKSEDDLGQWNRYGDDGKGVAIGYDGKILNDIAKQCQCVEITEVIYDEKKQKEYIKLTIVPRIFEALNNAGNYANVINGFDSYEKMVMRCILSDVSAILLSAVKYKNEAYKKENEWRLFKSIPEITNIWRSEGSKRYSKDERYGDIVMKKISCINKPDGVISSCIDLDLGEFKNASKIIKKIILGPRFPISKKDLDLRSFLHIIDFDVGLPCVAHSEIQQSKISYVFFIISKISNYILHYC